MDDKLGLDRKKNSCSDVSEIDIYLYTRFVRKHSKNVPISGPLLQTQAVKFHKQISSTDDSGTSDDWLLSWKIHHR
jgi:hypothetical protein